MDRARYAALFAAEARQHLERCGTLLRVWERDASGAPPLTELFRAIHTVKGMAATMGYDLVAAEAHAVEERLAAARLANTLTTDDVAQLWASLDTLERSAEDALAAEARGGEQGGAVRTEVVRVSVAAEAPLPGARALLALRRLEAFGDLIAVRPPVERFERADFDGRFAAELRTRAPRGDLEQAVRGAGEIGSVAFGVEEGTQAPRLVPVEASRLDRLTRLAADLSATRHRVGTLARTAKDAALHDAAAQLGRQVDALRAEVLGARMAPARELLAPLPRLVRELARSLGREIDLVTDGEAVELDRSVLEALDDGLVHLVRNACDHGLEPAAEREAAGKPRRGRLLVSVSRQRDSVELLVRDDGRGVDAARVHAKAVTLGLRRAGAPLPAGDELLALLAHPGFSTREAATAVSGRGVGLDAVVAVARDLGGSVALATQPGRGTAFTIRVPATVALMRALVTRVGGERYLVPLTGVVATLRTPPDDALPLAQVLGVSPTHTGRRPLALALAAGTGRVAVVVDEVLGQQEIVLEPLAAPSAMAPLFAGATILPDGQPALVLDAAALVERRTSWTTR